MAVDTPDVVVGVTVLQSMVMIGSTVVLESGALVTSDVASVVPSPVAVMMLESGKPDTAVDAGG